MTEIKVFDLDHMHEMLHSQQSEPFKPGQRINENIATLLNGLGDVLSALDFYQQSTDAGEPNSFLRSTSPAEPTPQEKDVAAHTPSPEKEAALFHAYRIDSQGNKTKIEPEGE